MTGSAARVRLAICIGLAALVFTAFIPVLRNGFVGYDDPDYVTANPHVNTGVTARNVLWAATAAHANNWHPLTWISHQLDSSVFGQNARGHHLSSLILHIANTLLLFLWLGGATGDLWASAFVAAIFGVHPAHVESVAWVSERKDVLSAFFGILAIIAYTRRRVWWAVAWFAASLAAKQMLVTFPLLLLVLDRWPLCRKEPLTQLVREKVPFFVLAGLASAAALWAQRAGGALAASEQLPAGIRLANAACSYLRYLGETLWPAKLAAFYPYPSGGIAAWMVAASVAALAAFSAAAFNMRKRSPWVWTGWAWYLITLLPAIGIVQVGMQSMADRYLYVPMVGSTIAIAWTARRRRAAVFAGVAAVLVCAVLAARQVQYWNNGETLWRHTIAVTDGNYVAHDNLGVELDRAGRPDEALAEYRTAVAIRPGDRNGEYNYGQALFAKGERLFRAGKYHEAAALFEEGLRRQPASAAAETYLGVARAMEGDLRSAMACFDAALRIDPSYEPAKAARAEMARSIRQ
jgi:tetratricopeptide (TPR) repeat protein